VAALVPHFKYRAADVKPWADFQRPARVLAQAAGESNAQAETAISLADPAVGPAPVAQDVLAAVTSPAVVARRRAISTTSSISARAVVAAVASRAQAPVAAAILDPAADLPAGEPLASFCAITPLRSHPLDPVRAAVAFNDPALATSRALFHPRALGPAVAEFSDLIFPGVAARVRAPAALARNVPAAPTATVRRARVKEEAELSGLAFRTEKTGRRDREKVGAERNDLASQTAKIGRRDQGKVVAERNGRACGPMIVPTVFQIGPMGVQLGPAKAAAALAGIATTGAIGHRTIGQIEFRIATDGATGGMIIATTSGTTGTIIGTTTITGTMTIGGVVTT
jgi:hypothetical protein